MKSGVFRDVVAKLSYQGRHGKRGDHIGQQNSQDHCKTNVGAGLSGRRIAAMAAVNPTPLSQASQLPQSFAFRDEIQAYCAAA
ncbi:hypothetical protein AAHI06_26370 [Pseudomonas salmasensis]|uniref:hypothetical protein n=1 Tax=Pseudomonas salmasensis TaxID=2745514 RepID=UPI003219512D